jgi:hypothetical protein
MKQDDSFRAVRILYALYFFEGYLIIERSMHGKSASLSTIAILMLFVAPFGCGTEEAEENGTGTIACPALHVLQGGTLSGPGVEHAGPITGDETWTAEDSPHVVNEWLVVDENHRLTIDPCAVVVMKDRTAIQMGSGWGAGGGSTLGDLVAVGTPVQPILVTGQRKEPGAWARLEFNRTTGQSRLAHVTVEYAGDEDASEAAATLVLTGPDTMAPAPLLTVEHVTLRSGAGVGLLLDGGGELSPSSQDLGIHGMSGRPVLAGAIAARSLPDGDYTGNGDDRIHLIGEGAVAPASAGDVTWRNLGVPYLYEIGTYQNWHSRLTLEPGLEVFVMNDQDPDLGLDDNGIIGVQCGGSIVAEGDSDGVITFRGEGERHWGGFNFERLEGSEDCNEPGVSRFAHVRLLHAGTQGSCNGDDPCFDLDACTAAIKLNGPYLQMQDSEINGISGSMYAIAREYCGSGDEGLAGAGLGNRFIGPMHCPQTDQNECDPVGGACSENTTCCQHDYTCHGEVE